MSLLTALLGPSNRGGSLNSEWRGRMGSFFGSWMTPAGSVVTPDNALQTTAVLACVRVISEAIAQTPWHTYQRLAGGRKSIATKHLLSPVLRRPNSWQTAFEFKEFMGVCLALRGNFYALIRPGLQGAASELWPLHPDRVRIERLASGVLRYQVRQGDGSETPYLQDEIFHVRWMSLDGVNGVTPITYAANSIGLSRAAETHGSSFFKNGARPGVVLETDKPMTEGNIKETLRGWNEMHRGAENSNKTAVLPFNLKAHELGLSNIDAQFLETRRYQTEEIARIYRVPPHMIGDLSRSTNNNIQQQSLEFLTFTMLPWFIRIEEAGDRDLLTDADEYYIKFNVDGFKRGDLAARSAFYREMVNTGIFCINECRELEDMNPVEGGDVHLIQGAMTTLDRIINPPVVAPPKKDDAESKAAEVDELRKSNDALRAAMSEYQGMLESERKRRAGIRKKIAVSESATELERAKAAAAEARVELEQAALAQLRVDFERATNERVVMTRDLDGERRQHEETRRQLAESVERLRHIDAQKEELTLVVERTRSEAEELRLRSAAAVADSLKLVEKTAADMLRLEVEAVRKATRKPNFIGEIDELREKQVERMRRALCPVVEIAATARGYKLDSRHVDAITAHADRSHRELLDAAGAAKTTEELGRAVESVLSSWQSRPVEFVQHIFEVE